VSADNFPERYLIARYSSGGVAVDLKSGNYYRLNGSATLVCEALHGGHAVEKHVAAALQVPAETAVQLIAEVVATLGGPAVHGTPQGSYHFYPGVGGGYALRHGVKTVLEVLPETFEIRQPIHHEAPSEEQLELYARALAPKLLFQRGVTVLHASSCITPRGLTAFAGMSGAGKTTTARAFAAAGAQLVSEDLLVLVPDVNEPRVFLEGENFAHNWAQQLAGALVRNPGRSISAEGLLRPIGGQTQKIKKLLFLDRSRRTGDQMIGRALDEPDALVTFMTHAFLGALEPEAWRKFFASAVDLVAKIPTEEVSVPEGAGRLPEVAAVYMAKSAS
jgi:hypothetical protein